MNKTVNINLANILFHIDEDAFNKMRRYLESVRRSFANTPGSDEILADIEARIAELFTEKLNDPRQVITSSEVEEVITIMGQPEDYMVDEDIFEDEPRSRSTSKRKRVKKLYRDTDMKYVAGVSSGLAHYVGIDPLWVRLLWILLTIGSGGGFILLYGLLWILIPEANSTSEKLDMRGEDINISNIERKVKEGFDDVANTVKNVDYDAVGNKVKSGGKTFFDTIGSIIMFFFKILGKFIGIILVITGAAAIIGMFIGMLTVGLFDVVHLPGLDGFIDSVTETPVWLMSLLFFFAIGIPFFFLTYLGLKILVTNLKSIGNVAKFSLLGLWLISIVTIIVLGVREAASHAFEGGITTESELYLENATDTLFIQQERSTLWENGARMRMDDSIMTYDDNGEPVMVSDDVRFHIKKSVDSVIRIKVRKEANGPSLLEARGTAKDIIYEYTLKGNTLVLNDYLTIMGKSRFKDQQVRVNLYIPVGTYLRYNSDDGRGYTMRADKDADVRDVEGYLWKMGVDGELKCQDCPERSFNYENDEEDKENKIRINEDGVDINFNDNDGDSFKMKIDEDGIDIKAKDDNSSDDNVDIKINSDGVKVKTNNTNN